MNQLEQMQDMQAMRRRDPSTAPVVGTHLESRSNPERRLVRNRRSRYRDGDRAHIHHGSEQEIADRIEREDEIIDQRIREVADAYLNGMDEGNDHLDQEANGTELVNAQRIGFLNRDGMNYEH